MRRERPVVRPLFQRSGQQHRQTLGSRTCRHVVETAGGHESLRIGSGREESGETRLRRRLLDARDRQVRLDVCHFPLRPLPVEARSFTLLLAHSQQLDQAPQLRDAGIDRRRPLLRQHEIGERQAERRLDVEQIGIRLRARRLGRAARRFTQQSGAPTYRQLLRNQQEVVPVARGVLAREADCRVERQAPFERVRLHLAHAEPKCTHRWVLLAHARDCLRLGQRLRRSRTDRTGRQRHYPADRCNQPQPSPLVHCSAPERDHLRVELSIHSYIRIPIVEAHAGRRSARAFTSRNRRSSSVRVVRMRISVAVVPKSVNHTARLPGLRLQRRAI